MVHKLFFSNLAPETTDLDIINILKSKCFGNSDLSPQIKAQILYCKYPHNTISKQCAFVTLPTPQISKHVKKKLSGYRLNERYLKIEDFKFEKFVDKLFPILSIKQKKAIRFDEESEYSATIWTDAQSIAHLIFQFFNFYTSANRQMRNVSTESNDLSITDATSCIGGNIISIIHYFRNSIQNSYKGSIIFNVCELDKTRFTHLVNNLKIFKQLHMCKNLWNFDFNQVLKMNIKQTLLFIDPPWEVENIILSPLSKIFI